jgi:hypothetical protein
MVDIIVLKYYPEVRGTDWIARYGSVDTQNNQLG